MPTDFDERLEEAHEPNPEDRWGDPEDRWGDPETDLVSVPSVDAPGDEDAAGIDIDSDLAKLFWLAVIYTNVALGGVSIGLLLVAFRGQWTWGGGAVAVGLFACYRTYDIYRTYQAEVVTDDDGADTGDHDADSTSGSDADLTSESDATATSESDATATSESDTTATRDADERR
ncbi:hypothetical protein DVK02_02060 [Halobellus sp. Atlit-31R]|nr:hypothetical protein DVK02_02060 [Halobellus sp. Atlit-31R]